MGCFDENDIFIECKSDDELCKRHRLTELEKKANIKARRINRNIKRTIAKYPQINDIKCGYDNMDFVQGLVTVIYYVNEGIVKNVFRVKKYKNL